jgi:hypothetical protein
MNISILRHRSTPPKGHLSSKNAMLHEIVLSDRNLESLHSVVAQGARFNTKPARFRVDFPELSPPEAAIWGEDFGRLYNDCGCGAAAVALVVTLTVAVAFVLLQPGGPFATTVSYALVAAGSVVGSVILGKALARRLTRGRLRSAVNRFRTIVNARRGHDARAE